jgi:crotonobetainyl-CoA:carnitine CoA-transferase CaiB-like acyl-CoA transferase
MTRLSVKGAEVEEALRAAPLTGVKVVEAGRFAAGPSCATVLADWGADIVKLEPPDGDPARGPGSLVGEGGTRNPRFELHNRSRRSVAIDAKTPQGQAAAQRLVGAADVFVTNLRPGALGRLGLDPDVICDLYPRLVYAQINGYGVASVAADEASYDHGAFWAYSGIASTFEDDHGVPPQPNGGLGDRSAGAMLAGAVGAALFDRERTGQGSFVSISLLATGVWMLGSDVSDALVSGRSHRSTDRRYAAVPTLNCFRAGDGRWFWLQMMVPERQWASLVDALEAPALEEDPRFRGGDAKRLSASSVALVETLDEIFRSRPMVEWETRFHARGIPFALVHSIGEMVADPVADDSGGFKHVLIGDVRHRVVASPVEFHGTVPVTDRPAPRVGEHTVEVLSEVGLSAEEIEALTSRPVGVTTSPEG